MRVLSMNPAKPTFANIAEISLGVKRERVRIDARRTNGSHENNNGQYTVVS